MGSFSGSRKTRSGVHSQTELSSSSVHRVPLDHGENAGMIQQRGMMMPDDLDPVRGLGEAMPMMKEESLGLPRFEQLKFTAQRSIVVSRHDDRFARILYPLEQLTRWHRRGLVVHQIAEE